LSKSGYQILTLSIYCKRLFKILFIVIAVQWNKDKYMLKLVLSLALGVKGISHLIKCQRIFS
jgi:hypothetical protein